MVLFVLCLCVAAAVSPDVEFLYRSINGGRPLTIDSLARHAESLVGDPVRDVSLMRPLMDRLDANNDGLIEEKEFAKAFFFGANDLFDQIHLSLAGSETMYVTWVSDASVAGPPQVRWGIGSELNNESNGTSGTYNAGWGWNKTIHSCSMNRLQGGQTYSYQIGLGGVWSPVGYNLNFTTNNGGKSTIAFLGDQGTVQPLGFAVTAQVAEDCKTMGCDAVHILGDLSYAWGTVPGPEIEGIWDTWSREAQAYSTFVPQMVTVGNHEGYDGGAAYKARFRMPGPESSGDGNYYWSQDIGVVHLVSISTDLVPTSKEAQMAWLISDLTQANSNRARVPWIVLTTHHPMYSSDRFAYSSHIPGSGEQEKLEPVLQKFAVDLMLSGHCHVYERVSPLVNGTPVVPHGSSDWFLPNATCHVVQGTGGAYYWDKWVEPQPVWSSVREIHYGYGLLQANSTHLLYQYRLEKDRSIHDTFVIRRD